MYCTSSPLCGSFQVFGFPEVQQTVLDIIDEEIDLRDSTSYKELSLINQSAPILATVIAANTINGKLDPLVGDVLKYTLLSINELLINCTIPCPERYGPPVEHPYECFPGFPMILGRSVYAMDKTRSDDDLYCRKLSGSHPTLSPGMFTVFCRHRVCLGFSLMSHSESPKTPFDIFLRRFSPFLPQMRIFYDNACNLHQYILNREPARFAETTFLVDRLHYQDHSACSEGYSTNIYNADPTIKKMNTQLNEQANADLRNLSKQVSYMKPENVMVHAKVFLAERNRKVKTVI